ncbi:hypothetical protein MED01_005731 [Micromonospora sp. MED01]|uniref:hypothetical protein n=1 Tax=Micromonospora alfalfae TaxID=2911212 RepID=UPI001EE854A5|nr:hypothetical protein [Micromonospora alfalfae]MCG5466691.1 hypothetical protein [Micromonospora alfalfae]
MLSILLTAPDSLEVELVGLIPDVASFCLLVRRTHGRAALHLALRAFRIARAYVCAAFDMAVAAQQPDVWAWSRSTPS